MKKIRQDFHIRASRETVFRALTDPILFEQWSESHAVVSNRIGANFSIFNGYITGTNLEIAMNERIVQDWRTKHWTKPSSVSLTLVKEQMGTKVELRHEGIPDKDYVEIQQGWNKFYLGKIQRFFGA